VSLDKTSATKLTKPIQRTTPMVLARSPSGKTIAATPSTINKIPEFHSVPVTPGGAHASHGSTGNLSPMVDKMVGSAYDVVRECVYNLEYIKHVSAHLEQIYLLAQQITEGGSFMFRPAAIANPVNNGDVVFELTSNTKLTIKAKGSDGIIRKVALTLAP